MCFTCKKAPKMMIIRPVSNTRLEDVQPTILLTIKRRAPATTSATPIAEANFLFFTSLHFHFFTPPLG